MLRILFFIVAFLPVNQLYGQAQTDSEISFIKDSILIQVFGEEFRDAKQKIDSIVHTATSNEFSNLDSSSLWELSYYQFSFFDYRIDWAIPKDGESIFVLNNKHHSFSREKLIALFENDSTMAPLFKTTAFKWKFDLLPDTSLLIHSATSSEFEDMATSEKSYLFVFKKVEEIKLASFVPIIYDPIYGGMLEGRGGYFSIKHYRKNGSLKEEIRSDGNGHVLIIKHRWGKTKTKRKYDKSWIRSQAPPQMIILEESEIDRM